MSPEGTTLKTTTPSFLALKILIHIPVVKTTGYTIFPLRGCVPSGGYEYGSIFTGHLDQRWLKRIQAEKVGAAVPVRSAQAGFLRG
jgi:hypothetical protein